MIIGPDYVYINQPRAASHSIQHWLQQHHKGKRYRGRRFNDDHYHAIERDIPDEHRHKFRWTVVRDPIEQVKSSFAFERNRGMMRDPVDFVRYRIKHADHAVYRYMLPQLDRASGADMVLRYEDLPGCLLELPFVNNIDEFPHIHQGPGWKPDLPEEAIALIREHERALYDRGIY